jgi:ferredoxin
VRESLFCAECHVIVDRLDWVRVGGPYDDEEESLDRRFDLTPTSRLGCQIVMDVELEGIVVSLR